VVKEVTYVKWTVHSHLCNGE